MSYFFHVFDGPKCMYIMLVNKPHKIIMKGIGKLIVGNNEFNASG